MKHCDALPHTQRTSRTQRQRRFSAEKAWESERHRTLSRDRRSRNETEPFQAFLEKAMTSLSHRSTAFLVILLFGLFSTQARALSWSRDTILHKLVETDGAQALVAAVLYAEEKGALPVALSDVLGDKRSQVVLLAPSNAAFEKLLGLPDGFLNGLTIDQIKAALPDILSGLNLDANAVAAILLQHAALPRRANLFTASDLALLDKGEIQVASGLVLPVGIGASGVQINYETTIIRANVSAANGVIHYIDTVIVDELL
jgi:uncharacterized surface protein with fasciclin (FAS1) repeats